MKTLTMADRLESLFRSRPGQWIDSWELLRAGGHCGWRGRLTDLRHRGLRIENRLRRVCGADGQPFTVSEYKWVPSDLLQLAEGATDSTVEIATEASC